MITAIFENGVFRPIEKVDLPEGTTVRFEPEEVTTSITDLVPPGTSEVRSGFTRSCPAKERTRGRETFLAVVFLDPLGKRLEKMTTCKMRGGNPDQDFHNEAMRLIDRSYASSFPSPERVKWDEALSKVGENRSRSPARYADRLPKVSANFSHHPGSRKDHHCRTRRGYSGCCFSVCPALASRNVQAKQG